LLIGGSNPIRIQSMTNTVTSDIEATVSQARILAEAGCDLIRMTAPTETDALALKEISKRLRADGITLPICADLHFSPRIAMIAARYVDKIRINPGNFSGRPGRLMDEISDDDFKRGTDEARDTFKPLLELLKSEGRALRIGINHGSLSQRMVYRYGDTVRGMVESALEYIRFCEDGNFNQIILSMKSSNVRVMIYAYRELVSQMRDLGMNFPLHLGVTEAGGGIEGILKSSQGIGALLEDGIGDTIRVSLTDPPEMELGPARSLANLFRNKRSGKLDYPECGLDYVNWSPRVTDRTADRGRRFICGDTTTIPVTLNFNAQDVPGISPMLKMLPGPDSVMPADPGTASAICRVVTQPVSLYNSEVVDSKVARRIIPAEVLHNDVSSWAGITDEVDEVMQFHLTTKDVPQINSMVKYIHQNFPAGRIMLSIGGGNPVHRYRLLDLVLRRLDSHIPVDFLADKELCKDPVALASQAGALLADGLVRSVTLTSDVAMTGSRLFAFTILQGAGARIFSTEYISCPGCGRTLFNLEKTTAEIHSATAHLKGLKIGIMGCIVNGPGEMADADFGYIGSSPGRIDLYAGQDLQKKNVPEKDAVDALIGLIKSHDKWQDPQLDS
jgi:(E)-4-hydroxy-3-methylbut-2-enyl-diphosphate synthase